MASLTLNTRGRFTSLNTEFLLELPVSDRTPTSFRYIVEEETGDTLLVSGEGFRFSSDGKPIAGVVTTLEYTVGGESIFKIDGVAVPYETIIAQVADGQGAEGLQLFLGGDDEIRGSAGYNRLVGLTGNDVMFGAGGDDDLDGGAGIDTVVYDSFRTQNRVFIDSFGFLVEATRGVEGNKFLENIEVLSFADGRLVYEVSDRAAVVYRMYAAALDRAPDPLGFNGWITALEQGATAETIALSFTGSAEFGATYGALDNRGFVEQLYRNVLDREADAGGLAGWTSALDSGALTRGGVLVGFSESSEHIEKLRAPVQAGLWDQNETASSVARLYYAALERAPDAAGLAGWIRAAEGGATLAQVGDGFALSGEFQARYGALDDAGYVRQLYRNVLDREADAPGLAGWLDVLATGRGDRGDVLLGFSESLEFQIKTLPVIDGGVLLA